MNRKAGLYGSQNIVLSGKVFVEPACIIRGDLAHVRIGRYSIIKSGTILRPSLKHFNKGKLFVQIITKISRGIYSNSSYPKHEEKVGMN